MKRYVSCKDESLALICGKDGRAEDYLDDEVMNPALQVKFAQFQLFLCR